MRIGEVVVIQEVLVSVHLILLVLSCFCFAVETWRTKGLTPLGLALLVAAMLF